MFGTTPDVESVMRRLEMAIPSPSAPIRSASRTASEIVERLAHAIIDDVGDERSPCVGKPSPLARSASQPITEAIARDHDLADDLAGREVAHEPLRAGVTERAGERAADLAGDAKRAAVGLGM